MCVCVCVCVCVCDSLLPPPLGHKYLGILTIFCLVIGMSNTQEKLSDSQPWFLFVDPRLIEEKSQVDRLLTKFTVDSVDLNS